MSDPWALNLSNYFLGEEALLKGALIRENTAAIYSREEERRSKRFTVFYYHLFKAFGITHCSRLHQER